MDGWTNKRMQNIKQIYMSNFQSLEVVGRGSETQLQVTENLKGKV